MSLRDAPHLLDHAAVVERAADACATRARRLARVENLIGKLRKVQTGVLSSVDGASKRKRKQPSSTRRRARARQ